MIACIYSFGFFEADFQKYDVCLCSPSSHSSWKVKRARATNGKICPVELSNNKMVDHD